MHSETPYYSQPPPVHGYPPPQVYPPPQGNPSSQAYPPPQGYPAYSIPPPYANAYGQPFHNKEIYRSFKSYNRSVTLWGIAFLIIGIFDLIGVIIFFFHETPDIWGLFASVLYISAGAVGINVTTKNSNLAFIVLVIILLVIDSIALILGLISLIGGLIVAFTPCGSQRCYNQEFGDFFVILGIGIIIVYGVLVTLLGCALSAAYTQRKKFEHRHSKHGHHV